MARIVALSALALTVMTAGCVRVSSQQIGTTENGLPRYRITCNQSIDNCHDKARELCPRGFSTLSENGRSGEVKLGNDSADCTGSGSHSHCSDTGAAVPTFDGALVVECH